MGFPRKCRLPFKLSNSHYFFEDTTKPAALRHLKVDPVLKIDETFYKQADSSYVIYIFKENI